MTENGKELVVMGAGLPVLSPEQAATAMQTYQKMCEALLDKGDFQYIQGKKFKKKSAARKLAKAYGISTEVTRDEMVEFPDGTLAWAITIVASTPDGRQETADGMVEKTDGLPHNVWHNVRATALTRAKNRAIFDLVGMGEVSAEEMHGHESAEPAKVVDAEVVSVSTTPIQDDTDPWPGRKWVPMAEAETAGFDHSNAPKFKKDGEVLVLKEKLAKIDLPPADLPEPAEVINAEQESMIEEPPPPEDDDVPFEPAPTAGLTDGQRRTFLQALAKETGTTLSSWLKGRNLGTIKEVCADEVKFQKAVGALNKLTG